MQLSTHRHRVLAVLLEQQVVGSRAALSELLEAFLVQSEHRLAAQASAPLLPWEVLARLEYLQAV